MPFHFELFSFTVQPFFLFIFFRYFLSFLLHRQRTASTKTPAPLWNSQTFSRFIFRVHLMTACFVLFSPAPLHSWEYKHRLLTDESLSWTLAMLKRSHELKWDDVMQCDSTQSAESLTTLLGLLISRQLRVTLDGVVFWSTSQPQTYSRCVGALAHRPTVLFLGVEWSVVLLAEWLSVPLSPDDEAQIRRQADDGGFSVRPLAGLSDLITETQVQLRLCV